MVRLDSSYINIKSNDLSDVEYNKLLLALDLINGEKDIILIPDPGYASYKEMIKVSGGLGYSIPLTALNVDVLNKNGFLSIFEHSQIDRLFEDGWQKQKDLCCKTNFYWSILENFGLSTNMANKMIDNYNKVFSVSLNAIAAIAGNAACECYGVLGLASQNPFKDDINELLSRICKEFSARNVDFHHVYFRMFI